MNIAKLGRYLVYAVFFACTWIIHFIIAALICAPFMDDEVSGFVNALIFLAVFALPVLASMWATKAFAKRWTQVREERAQKKVVAAEVVQEPYAPVEVKPSVKTAKKVHVSVKPKMPEPGAYRSQSEYSRYGGADAELLSIDLMEGHQFENWCADMLKELGFVDVEVTPASGDQGVDVLAKKEGVKYAVQCKRYRTDLGNTPVQEVHAGKAMYHCHVGIVITNQHFTEGARALAQATDVLLWDRDFLKAYLQHRFPEPAIPKKATASSESAYLDDKTDADLEYLYLEAVRIVIDTQQASVSMLQRRMKLGYVQAARLMDMMEARKVVGPFNGSTPRKILIHTHK